ncbi:glycosyltransferase [Patescibacteria group bacterium]
MKPTICLTGTHLTPTLALIEKLKAENLSTFYLGRKTLTEQTLLPELNVKLFSIISPKLNRHQPLTLVTNILKLPIGLIQSIYLLKKLKATVIVSFGGHVAIPVCLAGKLLNIPIIIHEQTFAAGLTSKITALLAKKIAVSWPASQKHFPAKKTVLTGNLVRSKILTTKRTSSQQKTLYITGGNQGSRAINSTVNQVLKSLLQQYTIYHQFGMSQSAKNWQQQLKIHNSLPKNLKSKYHLKKWFSEQELSKILSIANLAVTRSGINIVTELAFLKTPALLIPIPITQKNEQLVNANYLKDLGLASILKQSALTPESLLSNIQSSLNSLPKKSKLEVKFNHQLVQQATNNLYQLIQAEINEEKEN